MRGILNIMAATPATSVQLVIIALMVSMCIVVPLARTPPEVDMLAVTLVVSELTMTDVVPVARVLQQVILWSSLTLTFAGKY